MSMGTLITPMRVPFRAGSPEGNFLLFRGKDFSGFFPEPFPGVITTAAAITTATITATLVIITIAATVISGTLIEVKALPFSEIF